MAKEGYTIRDYGDEQWLVWIGYPERYSGKRVTHFVAQLNTNPPALEFAVTQLAEDLNAEVVDMTKLLERFYPSDGQ